eukprot:c13471_g1_i1 orf=2-730(-)
MDCFILGHPRAHAKLNQAHKSYHCSLHRRSNTANSTLSNKHNGLLTSSIQHWQLNPRLHKESFSANSKFHPATTSSFPAKPILKIRFNMLKSSKNGRLPSSSSRPLPPPLSSLSSPSSSPPSWSSSSSSSSLSTPSPSPSSSSPPSSSSVTTAIAKVLQASEEQEAALSHLLASKNLIEFIARVTAWADTQKESGMPQRQQRAFYSHQDWLQHRSSLRHMRHMLSSGSSRVILSLIPPVFAVT